MNQSLPEVTLRPRRIAVDGENSITFKATLEAVIVREEQSSGYAAHCPALTICSQGDTVEEAESCIAEAVELFIESSIERNMLDKVLHKRGFRLAGQPAVKNPAKDQTEYFGEIVRKTQFTVELQVKV